MSEAELQRQINELRDQIDRASRMESPYITYLTAPLTSTSWDGDARSTTAKTLIDLSAVFSAPAGIKAVHVVVSVRDSGSDTATDRYLILSPNDTSASGYYWYASGHNNDAWYSRGDRIPCNSDGDIYYQIAASGAGTFDVYLQVWGYEI